MKTNPVVWAIRDERGDIEIYKKVGGYGKVIVIETKPINYGKVIVK